MPYLCQIWHYALPHRPGYPAKPLLDQYRVFMVLPCLGQIWCWPLAAVQTEPRPGPAFLSGFCLIRISGNKSAKMYFNFSKTLFINIYISCTHTRKHTISGIEILKTYNNNNNFKTAATGIITLIGLL